MSGEIFIEFAKFEERAHEHERSRVIYKYALDRIPKAEAGELYKEFITFEKQHGSRTGIDDVIVNKRRFQYEAQVVVSSPSPNLGSRDRALHPLRFYAFLLKWSSFKFENTILACNIT